MRIADETIETVRKQFELDCNALISVGRAENCAAKGRIHIHPSKILPGARIVQKTDSFFRAILYMGEAYIMADPVLIPWAREYFSEIEPEWFCRFNNLRIIDRVLLECGREIADTHIYFLPDRDAPQAEPIGPIRWLEKEQLQDIKGSHPFSNALCDSPTQPDVLAVAAIENGEMIGMAGCSDDGRYLWQIGVDILPGHRGRGLAANLTALLKQEIIRRGKVPFYGTNESHGVSRSVAVKAGFLPAWAELYTQNAGSGRTGSCDQLVV